MPSDRRSRVQATCGVAAGWLLLIAEHGAEIYRRRNDPHFAPEVGPVGVFWLYGALLSVFYGAAVGLALAALRETRAKHPETTRLTALSLALACMGVTLVLFLWGTEVTNGAIVAAVMTPPLVVAGYSMTAAMFQSRHS